MTIPTALTPLIKVDSAAFAANPGTGSATVYATFSPGPIVGKRKIQYSVVA